LRSRADDTAKALNPKWLKSTWLVLELLLPFQKSAVPWVGEIRFSVMPGIRHRYRGNIAFNTHSIGPSVKATAGWTLIGWFVFVHG
jgi:hypothetical protein